MVMMCVIICILLKYSFPLLKKAGWGQNVRTHNPLQLSWLLCVTPAGSVESARTVCQAGFPTGGAEASCMKPEKRE